RRGASRIRLGSHLRRRRLLRRFGLLRNLPFLRTRGLVTLDADEVHHLHARCAEGGFLIARYEPVHQREQAEGHCQSKNERNDISHDPEPSRAATATCSAPPSLASSMTRTTTPVGALSSAMITTLPSGFSALACWTRILTWSTSTLRFDIQTSPVSDTAIITLPRTCGVAVSAAGRRTSRPASFTKEVVTTKKINMMNTMSSIGVMSIAASSPFLACFLAMLASLRHPAPQGAERQVHSTLEATDTFVAPARRAWSTTWTRIPAFAPP